jgi:hypothetical protein
MILWARWSVDPRKKRLKSLIPFSDLLTKLEIDWRIAYIVEFMLFVAIGSFVAVKVMGFTGCREAFSGGLGRTGLLVQIEPAQKG